MNAFKPDLATFYDVENKILAARLDAIRAVISHGGEKGRALEAEISKLLRSILPSEYGLSTGFIAYEQDGALRLSPQLDIIIYDALRSGPLARLESCDVFPLEATYGYVEVKAALRTSRKMEPPSDSLEYCLRQCAELRQMRMRRYFCPISGTTTGAQPVSPLNTLAIRSWVFAFEPIGRIANPDTLARRMADYSASLDPQPHLHGLFVVDTGYFRTVPVNLSPGAKRTNWSVEFTTDHALSAFKWDLIHGLARFDRMPQDWTADVVRYGPTANYSQVSSTFDDR